MRELTVSEWALREGIVISADRQARPRRARATTRGRSAAPRCCRSAAARAGARPIPARSPGSPSSCSTRRWPLHRLEADDRELLELGALLHDIGEHVSRDGHARHSAYLIENGDLRGFSPIEIQMLACLGRYHVRGRPRESFQAVGGTRPQGPGPGAEAALAAPHRRRPRRLPRLGHGRISASS